MIANLKRISMALGLLAAGVVAPVWAGPAHSVNQATADAVAEALRASSALAGYRIAVDVQEGLVTLSGAVSSPEEHAEAISRARNAPGVVAVVDYVRVEGDSDIRQVQYQVAPGGPGLGGTIIDGGAPMMGGAPMDGTTMTGPMPEGPAGLPGATQAAMPGMPNYAWPSYAPHPNFSAVGYPTVYPWQAWPNIGPFYPYPEVPLDWRAVTLRWDDGLWWLDFKKHYTRPFFAPYTFGLFGY